MSITTAITSGVLACVAVYVLWVWLRHFEWLGKVWGFISKFVVEIVVILTAIIFLIGMMFMVGGMFSLQNQITENDSAIVETLTQTFNDSMQTLQKSNPGIPVAVPQIAPLETAPTPAPMNVPRRRAMRRSEPEIYVLPPAQPKSTPTPTPQPTITPKVIKVPGRTRWRTRKPHETLWDKLFKKRSNPKRTR